MTADLQATVEARKPHLLDTRAILILNSYGLVLMIPALAAIVIVSILPLSWWSVIIPVAAVFISLLCLPLGFGNPSLSRWVRPLSSDPGAIVVQVRFTPHRRSITRSLMEDADDIGLLSTTPEALIYRGDAFQLQIPRQRIAWVQSRNIGWRGFFIYGNRCVVGLQGVPELTQIELAERQSFLLPQSWGIARRISKGLRPLAPSKA